ncbi:MAG: HAD family hydrolase [Candidatus Obscuribacterales bacterium]|nr:HAD family hydrolase [Candidatus Obscuribacterales bacterium]
MIVPSSTRVILFDLWMTLIYSLNKDPVLSLQEFFGYKTDVKKRRNELDPDFLTACLTTNISCPGEFLACIALRFGLDPRGLEPFFLELLRKESGGVQKYEGTDTVLATLKSRGFRLGLVSNLWPFPVKRVFDELNLGIHFEQRIYSFEVGASKPDKRIYEAACRQFDVSPDQCLFVGDSLANDVCAPLAFGMPAVLVNRSGSPAAGLPAGAYEITSLQELLEQE